MFQCTDDVTVVLNTTYTKGESISPNIKYFTNGFSIDVNNDTQHVVSLCTSSIPKSIVKYLIFGDIDSQNKYMT